MGREAVSCPSLDGGRGWRVWVGLALGSWGVGSGVWVFGLPLRRFIPDQLPISGGQSGALPLAVEHEPQMGVAHGQPICRYQERDGVSAVFARLRGIHGGCFVAAEHSARGILITLRAE